MDFAPQTLPFPSFPLDHLSSIGVGEKRSIVLNFCLIHNHHLLAHPILVDRDRPNLESILDFPAISRPPHLPINFQSPAKSQSNDEARPASGITQLEIFSKISSFPTWTSPHCVPLTISAVTFPIG